jgi:hypothetical protein
LEGVRRLGWQVIDKPAFRTQKSPDRLNSYAQPAGTVEPAKLVTALLEESWDAVLTPGTRPRWLKIVARALREGRPRVILRFQVGRRGHLIAVYGVEWDPDALPAPGVGTGDRSAYRYRIERLTCRKRPRGEALDELPEGLHGQLVLTLPYPGRIPWSDVVRAVDEATSGLPAGDFGQPRYPPSRWP